MSEALPPGNDGREALVRASAVIASWSRGGSTRGEVARALRAAAERAGPPAVEEMLLQSYLFLGYPAALNALAVWREVGPGAAAAPAPDGPEAPEAWTERGEEVCRVVYGGQYDALRKNIRRLHPEMERWMVAEGYGKVLGRPALALDVRELCVVAVLAVARWPTQLYSHLRGALNAGASEGEVERALELALQEADDEARREARATWRRLQNHSSQLYEGS